MKRIGYTLLGLLLLAAFAGFLVLIDEHRAFFDWWVGVPFLILVTVTLLLMGAHGLGRGIVEIVSEIIDALKQRKDHNVS